jgi:hypothetical protein
MISKHPGARWKSNVIAGVFGNNIWNSSFGFGFGFGGSGAGFDFFSGAFAGGDCRICRGGSGFGRGCIAIAGFG